MSYEALLFCPDEKTARVVKQVLNDVDFRVEPCNEPFAAVKRLMAQHFDAIVVDCENEQNANLLFKSAHNSAANQSALSVALVEGQAGVAKAFRLGANLVLTKPINVEQSKGTLRVARGLLRKGEAGKSATVPAETTPRPSPEISGPGRAAPPIQAAAKPLPPPYPPQKAPRIPAAAASTSAFEVEQEPTPEPSPAEAALLESMPEPVRPRSQPATLANTPPMKEYPWQPVSRPSGAMASALQRAAEAAGKPRESAPSANIPLSDGEGVSAQSAAAPVTLGLPSSGGTGAATAPAKEISPWVPKPLELKPAESSQSTIVTIPEIGRGAAEALSSPASAPIEPPAFGISSSEIDEQGTSSRKPLIIVAAILLLAVAGYFGWSRMHATSSQTTPASSVAAQSRPPSNPAPTPTQPTSSILEQPSAEISATPLKASKPTPSVPVSKPPASKSPVSDIAADTTTKVAEENQSNEPLIVKSGHAQQQPKPAAQEPPQPAAPPVIGVVPSSDNKAIAGIISSPTVSVPKPAPQSLRISQGIAQGLLIKRVPPIYPAQAQQMRIQGAVDLAATISKEGSITNIKVLRGDPVLTSAAVKAVRQWKYKPYYLDGEPVEIQTQITINFKLP